MTRRENQIHLFLDNIEDASECFNIDAKGNLHTLVNTEYLFSKYDLHVIFHKSFVQIITQIEDDTMIIQNKDTIHSMEILLKGLNVINKNGEFYLDNRTHKICFMSLCYLEDIINAEYPWRVLFSGIETINHFSESIKSVYNGSVIFYMGHLGL